ncbi:hypothetical protein DEU56DRAFT_983037 [Suillus clintonianus]|uniref:uncharacterized protein n=1 Tax=Suillus clintonianus TaxID=1904413 RepID=UPI001B8822E4|nr:uncharacterized protein DEU56DRAFT_983037 [Suillus clintonianus]KAG2126056.1 hypothetical protein DEU56DRAFT_983037 [Suillus clintonianus]
MSFDDGKGIELADIGSAQKTVYIKELQESTVRADDIHNEPHPQPSSFFSSGLARARREYFSITLHAVAFTLVLMWILLSVYWAALAYPSQLTRNLTALFIDRDNNTIGHALWAAINDNTTPGSQLGWSRPDPTIFASDEDVMQAVISEQVWLALVLETNATDKLSAARQTGNSTFNPTSLLTVYYVGARNEIATGTYLIPIYSNLLGEVVSPLATTSAQQYLAQIYAQGQANETALQLIAQAPQTISPGISWTSVDLRPFYAPVASAVLVVGLIYQLIFTFIMVEANAAARAPIQGHLRLSSFLRLRLAVPLLIYVPMSLTYVLVSLAFGLPMDGKFSAAGGFFVMWIYIYLGTSAFGLALESIIILFPKLTSVSLFSLIIANISTSILPQELMPAFFRFGIAFPFLNVSQAMRTIVFNTHSYLPRNAAVLIGWIVISALTIILCAWYPHNYKVTTTATLKTFGRRVR